MTENQFISKLKELKQIKPNQDWVFLTKNQILGQGDFVKPVSESSIISVFQTFFQARHFKPAFAVITAVLLLFIGIAGFFHLTEEQIEIAEVPEAPVEIFVEAEQAEMIILALEGLQTEVNRATETLKKIEEPQKILEARNEVVSTIKAIREVIAEVEKLETKQDQILANIIKGVDGFENTLDRSEANFAINLIEFLETRTLTDAQQEILEKAQQAYIEGNYAEALEKSMMIYKTLNR